MHVPLTFALLSALTGVLVLVRVFWRRIPHRVRLSLTVCAILTPIVSAIAFLTHWRTFSDRLDAGFYWASIASYEFFLILFTRLRPRWLTTAIAIVLILPVLSASVFLPLTDLFNQHPATITSIGDHLVSERVPWGSGAHEIGGTDLSIFSKPPWAPFLRRRRRSCRYYNSQCNAGAAFAVLQPDRDSVLMVCPASPGQPPDTARRAVVKFE